MLLASSRVEAAASTGFAETSRVAALADAVSARPGDAGSMLWNPAGLADLTEPQVLLSAGGDHLRQWFARTSEPQTNLGRSFGAFGLAAATPLPGPWWLRRVRVGLALDLPAQYVLSANVPQRIDQPTSPVYGSRPDHVTALGAVAVDVLDQVKIGGGVNVTPSLTLPTTVTFVPGRTTSIQSDVEVSLEEDLPLAASPFLGVRAQPLPYLGLAVVFRGEAFSHVTGSQNLRAGPIGASAPVDYFFLWDPAQLVIGAVVGSWRGWSLSVDATSSLWSELRSGFDQPVAPAFRDTLSGMGGVEWATTPWLTLRGGGGFDPSPIPPQTGDSNYLGAGAAVLALGGGVDLRRLLRVPVSVDVHARARLGAEQAATKSAASLTDADPTTPGKQIDNLGYPGFSSRSSLYQAGLTLTVFAGGGKR